MERTISIPAELDADLERLAEKLQLKGSEVHERALRHFVELHDREAVTRKLDHVYSEPGNRASDPVVARMQFHTLQRHANDEPW